MPKVVTSEAWDLARNELLQAEKEATRTLDRLAAQRRRLPMVKIGNDYEFASSGGEKTSLLDLFKGKNQLVIYQFMDNGARNVCEGCSYFTNGVPEHALVELASNGISWANVSDMPISQIDSLKEKMGWKIPFVRNLKNPSRPVGEDLPVRPWLTEGLSIHRSARRSPRIAGSARCSCSPPSVAMTTRYTVLTAVPGAASIVSCSPITSWI